MIVQGISNTDSSKVAGRWQQLGSSNEWALWRASGSSDSPDNVGHLVQRMQQSSRSQGLCKASGHPECCICSYWWCCAALSSTTSKHVRCSSSEDNMLISAGSPDIECSLSVRLKQITPYLSTAPTAHVHAGTGTSLRWVGVSCLSP
jgi:hypothetical protein